MIPISTITADLAAMLQKKTGVFAGDERLSTAVYPSFYVTARPADTVLIAGGRQLFRRIDVSVTCRPSREREEGQGRALAERLYALLLPSLPLGGRQLTPTALEMKEADSLWTLSFTLEFCDLPAGEKAELLSPMEQLHFSLGGQGQESEQAGG